MLFLLFFFPNTYLSKEKDTHTHIQIRKKNQLMCGILLETKSSYIYTHIQGNKTWLEITMNKRGASFNSKHQGRRRCHMMCFLLQCVLARRGHTVILPLTAEAAHVFFFRCSFDFFFSVLYMFSISTRPFFLLHNNATEFHSPHPSRSAHAHLSLTISPHTAADALPRKSLA